MIQTGLNNHSADSDDAAFAQLVDEVVDHLQTGEEAAVERCLSRHPQYAARLGELLPTLYAMVEAGRPPSAAGGDEDPKPQNPETPQKDRELADFRILREIGRGGMGVVYEAEQISLRRRVALKTLTFGATLDRRQLQRFRNESRAAALLDHPNIVSVYSVGSASDVHYYAMQYIEGQTLANVIARMRQAAGGDASEQSEATQRDPDRHAMSESPGDREGSPEARLPEEDRPAEGGPPRKSASQKTSGDDRTAPYAPEKVLVKTHSGPDSGDTRAGPGFDSSDQGSGGRLARFRWVARIGIQVAEALEHAHGLGVVHRDIKPSNLMVDEEEQLWVTDFGLAQAEANPGLTMTGDIVGTLRYMSPEQATGDRHVLDHRTDIYSLGVTLYELLALRPAADAQHQRDVFRQIVERDPPRLRQVDRSIPRDLEVIVGKAMAKDPQSRYGSAQELADDLRRFLDDEPIQAKPPGLVERAGKWARRNRGIVAASLVTLAVAVLFAAGLLWQERSQTLAALEREGQQRRRAEELRDRAQEAADRERIQRLDAERQREATEATLRLVRKAYTDFRERMGDYRVFLGGANPEPLRLLPDPILDTGWRGNHDLLGSVFLWLNDRRPQALSVAFSYAVGDRVTTRHTFRSLATEPLRAEYAGHCVWCPPEAGVAFRPIPGSPPPAANPPERLGQMRSLAGEFVFQRIGAGQSAPLQLKIDTEPLYRYGGAPDGPSDGALFGFFQVRHLEGLLMIEARGKREELRWEYACATPDAGQYRALRHGAQVWENRWSPGLDVQENILRHPEYQKRCRISFVPSKVPNLAKSCASVASGYEVLADTLRELGRPQEAKVALEEAHELHAQTLAVRRRTLGAEDFETIELLGSVTQKLEAAGKHARAKDIWRETRGEEKRATPDQSPPKRSTVDYRMRISEPGVYQVYVRWDGRDYQSDVTCVGLIRHGETQPPWYLLGARLRPLGGADADFATYPWESFGYAGRVSSRHAEQPEQPATWDIAEPGEYTLRIWSVNEGAAVDAMVFQRAELEGPRSDGPLESRRQEGVFVASEGRVVLEAEHFTSKSQGANDDACWRLDTKATDRVVTYRNYRGSGYIQAMPRPVWPRGHAWTRAEKALHKLRNTKQSIDLLADSGQELSDLDLAGPDTPAIRTFSGGFEKAGDGIHVRPHSKLMFRLRGSKSYLLRSRFTRESGNRDVGFLIALGDQTTSLTLSGWNGTRDALWRINGLDFGRKESFRNGEPHLVEILVDAEGEAMGIYVFLDRERWLYWEGEPPECSVAGSNGLPQEGILGLYMHEDSLVLHSLTATPVRETVAPEPIRENGVGT